MADRTDLLVIGAGPYAYSAAACARDHGIDTTVVGLPMSFWREQMPADMYLRSGPDWHLDTAGEHTFAAYFEDRGLQPGRARPGADRGVPRPHRLVPRAEGVRRRRAPRRQPGGRRRRRPARFVATMEDGTTITAEKVLAAPGIRHFVNLPAGTRGCPSTAGRTPATSSTSTRSPARGWSSSAGGRAPTSGRPCSATTGRVGRRRAPAPGTGLRAGQLGVRRPLRRADPRAGGAGGAALPPDEQRAIALEFWQVGRLTLESWLTPR